LGSVCSAPVVCPCGSNCGMADQPGICVIPL
jgi:hypothetical protein